MLGERDYIKGNVKKDFQLLKIFYLIGVLVNLSVFISQGKLWIHLSLNLSELIDLKLWTPISSLFLAAPNGIISFIFDVLIFYYAGRRLEDYFGNCVKAVVQMVVVNNYNLFANSFFIFSNKLLLFFLFVLCWEQYVLTRGIILKCQLGFMYFLSCLLTSKVSTY